MIFIFSYAYSWVWGLLPILGVLLILASYLPLFWLYNFILKVVGHVCLYLGIFILGACYCNNLWKQQTIALETKVMEQVYKSTEVNVNINKQVLNTSKLLESRKEKLNEYIDTEIITYDTMCSFPAEFTLLHNELTESLK